MGLYGPRAKQIMATLQSVVDFARAQAQTDSNGLTNANAIIFSNEALLDFRRRLIAAGVDAAQLQEAYRDMSATVGTYLYPTDMWWLKAIELNYTGATQQNYITANQVDVSNLPNMESFGWLRANDSTGAPHFDDRGDWFEIFPTPTTSNAQGIRIFYFLEPTEFSSLSDTISYPESLDYRALGWRIASDYYYSLNKMLEGDAFNNKYEERVKQLIATLSRGSQQPITATAQQWSGFEF